MKLRIPLLALASLLVTGLLVSADPAPQTPDPAFTLEQLSTPASPDCKAAATPNQGLVPTALPAAPTCGSCSESICAGSALHSFCRFQGGRTYTCEAVLGNRCGGGTLTFECTCWYGPLP
jgi:hypothetical protein